MKEITVKQRESNFELLRIVAMLFIVLQHLCQHGFFFDNKTNTNYFIVSSFLGWTGNLGNYLFMLISGYFLCTSSFSFKKLFKLWLQIFTTSTIIVLVVFLSRIEIYVDPNEYVISGYTNLRQLNIKDLYHAFLPNIFALNWFATTYLIFYLFTPFLGILLKHISEKEHRSLVLIFLLVGNIITMFPNQQYFSIAGGGQYPSLFYFILCYFFASYIRFYGIKFRISNIIYLLIGIVMCFMFYLWNFGLLFIYVNREISFISSYSDFLLSYPYRLNSFPILFAAICVFLFFKNITVANNKIINLISKRTFGVYLISENIFLKYFMWHRLFRTDILIEKNQIIFFIALIGICLGAFFLSVILECAREYIVNLFIKRIRVLYKIQNQKE